jgi:hypothetical protein
MNRYLFREALGLTLVKDPQAGAQIGQNRSRLIFSGREGGGCPWLGVIL